MKAIILAGGKGTRLAPYTTILPKPLIPVGHKPILEIIIRQLIFYGFKDITLAVGYLAEIIQAYFQNNSYLAKKELFETKFSNWYFRKIHAIPLDRGEADPSALKKVLKILKSGRPMVLFPEGTRSKENGLQRGKPGIGFIVSKSGVPVVPAYIEGSYNAVPEGLGSIKRSRVNVFIGSWGVPGRVPGSRPDTAR